MYRLFYVQDDGDKIEGPSFETLEAALSMARDEDERCDILLPSGDWYGKQETQRIDTSTDIDAETRARLEANANKAVAWMRSRPSRNKKG